MIGTSRPVIHVKASFFARLCAGIFYGKKPNALQTAPSEVLMILFTAPPVAFRIIDIMIACGITRDCLGEDNTFKKRAGDRFLHSYLLRF